MGKISIIVPCYNEEAVIKKTTNELKDKMENLINKNKNVFLK